MDLARDNIWIVVGAVLLLGGCVAAATGAYTPDSTYSELCVAYGDFAQEWSSADSGLFDNSAFRSMEDLADVAKRYPSPAVQSNGEALERLAEGAGGFIVSVGGRQAASASSSIASTCG